MDDAISRSEAMGNGMLFDQSYSGQPLVVSVVSHEKDIRTSFVSVKNVDEWQDRIILVSDSTSACSVYYAEGDDCVNVVRCKDCTWFNRGFCMNFCDDVMPDDFCSRGHTET